VIDARLAASMRIERRRGTANHNHRSDTITIVKNAVPRSPPSTIDQYPHPKIARNTVASACRIDCNPSVTARNLKRSSRWSNAAGAV